MTYKGIYVLLCLIGVNIFVYGNNNDYSNYCRQMNEKMSIDFFVPQKMMDFHSDIDIPFITITFGDLLDDFPTNPIFEGGPIVKPSNNCSIIMMNIDLEKKVDTEHENKKDYSVPVSTEWMLNNCYTPWAEWYIEGVYGVRMKADQKQSGFRDLTEEERADLKERVRNLRLMYERSIENSEITNKINCDKIFIVRIPNLCNVSSIINSEYVDLIKNDATECYGVEFYKQSIGKSFKMLYFINGDKTTIYKSIKKISRYIRFH